MPYWEAIRFSLKKGFRRFDFGRSTPHEGTYKFKQQWGTACATLLAVTVGWSERNT
jgi:hypothetical protein